MQIISTLEVYMQSVPTRTIYLRIRRSIVNDDYANATVTTISKMIAAEVIMCLIVKEFPGTHILFKVSKGLELVSLFSPHCFPKRSKILAELNAYMSSSKVIRVYVANSKNATHGVTKELLASNYKFLQS